MVQQDKMLGYKSSFGLLRPRYAADVRISVALADCREPRPQRVGQRVTFWIDGPDKAGQLAARDVVAE
jgi:hypothetical protein